MEISTSTNICAFTPGRERNGFDFCIAQCAQGGYKVLDINFCESMNPHSRMRNNDWQDYVKDIAEMGRRWGVVFRQSHLPYYDIFAENDEEKVKTMEELIRRSIIASAELGVEWTVTHPGTVYSAGPDVSVSKEKNLEYYSRHVATARENGIGICLENDFEYRPRQPCSASTAPAFTSWSILWTPSATRSTWACAMTSATPIWVDMTSTGRI